MDFQLRSRAFTSRGFIFRGMRNSFHSESAFLFGGLMLANAVAYAYQMLLARIMSPADYGILVTLASISYVLAVLMRTFQAWVIKATTATRDPGLGQVRAIFSVAMRRLVPLGGVAFGVSWLASNWVADFLHLETATPVIVLGLYIFSSFLVPVSRGMLLGLNRLYFASLIHVLEPVVRLITGATLVVWGWHVNGALMGFAAGNLVAFAIGLVLLWPLFTYRRDPVPPAGDLHGWDPYAVLVLVANTCLMIIASVDQIAVRHFFSEQVAGNYAVAFLLGRVITMSTISLGWVVFARAALLPVDDPKQTHLFVKGLLATGAIAVTLGVGYLIAPALAVRLMGGSQYGLADTYVGLVGIEMTLFAFVYVQAYYHLSVKRMAVIWPLCLAVILEVALLALYHDTVQQVLLNLILVMGGLLTYVSALSWHSLRTPGHAAPITVE